MSDWPTGVAKFVLDELDSTNKEAVRRISEAPAWILAHAQSAGVGRRGRAWSTQTGNFAATFITQTTAEISDIALRSFVASLALFDSLIDMGVSSDRLALKWPNDVLFDDGKLAGILLETSRVNDQIYLSVGIGVNLAHMPESAKIEAASTPPKSLVTHGGLNISPERFLSVLAPAFDAREHQMQDEGFSSIRADWLSRAARLGEEITARTPNEDIVGIFTALDDTGAVIIETPQGSRAIHAADIFFG